MLSPVTQDERPKLGYTGHILDRGPVAQLGARFHGMEEVVSSNLTRSTNIPKHFSRFLTVFPCPIRARTAHCTPPRGFIF